MKNLFKMCALVGAQRYTITIHYLKPKKKSFTRTKKDNSTRCTKMKQTKFRWPIANIQDRWYFLFVRNEQTVIRTLNRVKLENFVILGKL